MGGQQQLPQLQAEWLKLISLHLVDGQKVCQWFGWSINCLASQLSSKNAWKLFPASKTNKFDDVSLDAQEVFYGLNDESVNLENNWDYISYL